MTIRSIVRSLTRRGFTVTRSLCSGKIVVTNSRGFFCCYNSYSHAYRSLI